MCVRAGACALCGVVKKPSKPSKPSGVLKYNGFFEGSSLRKAFAKPSGERVFSMSAGQRFEDWIGESGAAGLPVWFKVPNDRTVRGAQRRGSVWLDFVGVLPGGRCVTGDAKWVGVERHITRSLLNPDQRRHADQAHDTGALVVVLVGWLDGSQGRVSVVPWIDLRSASQDVTAWLCDDWCARVREVGDVDGE